MNIGESLKQLIESQAQINPRRQFYIYGIALIYLIIILSIAFEGTGPLV